MSEYSPHRGAFFGARFASCGGCTVVACSWPHDINHVAGGHVAQPFPDVCMALSTVWYLTDVGPENGSTWVVPGSVSLFHLTDCAARLLTLTILLCFDLR